MNRLFGLLAARKHAKQQAKQPSKLTFPLFSSLAGTSFDDRHKYLKKSIEKGLRKKRRPFSVLPRNNGHVAGFVGAQSQNVVFFEHGYNRFGSFKNLLFHVFILLYATTTFTAPFAATVTFRV